jgi:hypothetical protein
VVAERQKLLPLNYFDRLGDSLGGDLHPLAKGGYEYIVTELSGTTICVGE